MTDMQKQWFNRIPARFQGIYRKAMDAWRPLQAIRSKCLDCQNWQSNEVADCDVQTCPLWPYRMGRRARRTVVAGAEVECVNHRMTNGPHPTHKSPPAGKARQVAPVNREHQCGGPAPRGQGA